MMTKALHLHDQRKEAFLKRINSKSSIEKYTSSGHVVKKYIKEFWTASQRKGNPLHEISYRACFKSELPKYFIESLTNKGDVVYDPFMGRGTSIIEAALLNRKVIGNDINPLSKILVTPRLFIPDVNQIADRLDKIKISNRYKSDLDLSMFYHEDTLKEILSVRGYILNREREGKLDTIDQWIRMIATNKLTGHSRNFFSIYTLPPNQAVSPERQIKINEKRNQIAIYKNVKQIILIKSRSLLRSMTSSDIVALRAAGSKSLLLNNDARNTRQIPNNFIDLTITSPPFLNVIQYAQDNWLRCWFNGIDANEISNKITVTSSLTEWTRFMDETLVELFRVTKSKGFVGIEVGEVNKGKILLDEVIVDLGIKNGYNLEGICINKQLFTKTANIWGVSNNSKGTNSNRIVLLSKP